MDECAPLSLELIAERLDEIHESITTDEDAHRCDIQFAYDETVACRMMVSVFAAGDDRDILQIRVYTDRHVAHDDWDDTIAYCNAWNSDTRWPKSFLYVDQPTVDRTGGVILDYEIPLTGEIPPALFDGIYLPVFRGAIAFWKKASRELSFIAE